MLPSPSPSPLAHRFQDVQTPSLVELSASLLKIVAIAALVFGVILGAKQWLFIGAASGILSITLYAYSQSGTDESWNEWISRIIFSVRREPASPRSPENTDGEHHPRSFLTPKRTRHRRVTTPKTLDFKSSPPRGGDHLLSPVPERSKPNSPPGPIGTPLALGIYVPHEDGPGALESTPLNLDDQQ